MATSIRKLATRGRRSYTADEIEAESALEWAAISTDWSPSQEGSDGCSKRPKKKA
jgi:hypothetical protein